MTSVHFCFYRINPVLKIDLVQIGTLETEEFVPLSGDRLKALDAFLNSVGLHDFISRSDICRETYVTHDDVRSLLAAVPFERIDWFKDTLVVVVPVNLDSYETPEEEE